jgi:hypothetical protein
MPNASRSLEGATSCKDLAKGQQYGRSWAHIDPNKLRFEKMPPGAP